SDDADRIARGSRRLRPGSEHAPIARAADRRARLHRLVDVECSDAGRHRDQRGLFRPVAPLRQDGIPGGAGGGFRPAGERFFANGGDYCYVVAIKSDPTNGAVAASRLIGALSLTVALDDVDLVAVPDAHALLTGGVSDEQLVLQVQRAVIDHCRDSVTRVAL